MSDALTLFRAGDLEAARGLCQTLVAEEGAPLQAYEIMGAIAARSGDASSAIDAWQRAIALAPEKIDNYCRLGFLLIDQGRHEEAAAVLAQGIERHYDSPQAHFLSGNAFYNLGRFSEAVNAYQQAVMLAPAFADAHTNLGMAYKRLKLYPAAIDAFGTALNHRPGDAEPYFQIGLSFHALNDFGRAMEAYRNATRCNPRHQAAHYNLGILLAKEGETDAALEHYHAARLLAPDDAKVLNGLALALLDKGEPQQAKEWLLKAVAQRPDFGDAYINLGIASIDLEEYRQGYDFLQRAIAIDPSCAKAWYNLGICCQRLNRPEEAIPCYEKALALEPDFVQAHWNYSHALLIQGRFAEGFREYLWRWRRPGAQIIPIGRPLWQGEALPEGTLLIHTEQGLGDSIQFIRYLDLVAERVDRIMVACERSLADLFDDLPAVAKVISKHDIGNHLDAFDCYIPLLDLPTLLETTLATIPCRIPYLRQRPELVERFAPLFTSSSGRPRIGLVWKGNPKHTNDARRSCRLDELSPILDCGNAAFFSLQKQEDPALQEFPAITDLSPHMDSFADTAAIMAHLDLIITVDTSVAHLAGALGKPVWVLLPYEPDWRWMMAREDSPWYPSMRLFRQESPTGWTEVMARVRAALAPPGPDRQHGGAGGGMPNRATEEEPPSADVDVDALLAKGFELFNQCRLSEAALVYTEILGVVADHPHALHMLGVIAYEKDELDLSEEFLRASIARSPAPPHLYYANLATTLAAKERFDEAVSLFQHAIRMQPDFVRGYGQCGNTLLQQGKHQKAIPYLRHALELQPDYAEGHFFLGRAWDEQGLLDEALACYRQALMCRPALAKLNTQLGNAFNRHGYGAEALTCYRRGVALSKNASPPSTLRIESNAILRKACAALQGDVISIGSGIDTDKEGRLYREYFPQSSSYCRIDFTANVYPDIVGDIENLQGIVADQAYDVAFSFCCLEHVRDITAAISEIHRIVKRNGTFVFVLPLMVDYHAYPHDYHRFTLEGLGHLLADRFEILAAYPAGEEKPFALDPRLHLIGSRPEVAPEGYVGICRRL